MKNKAACGYTLPEIMIGMLILLLIFGAVTGLLSSGLMSSQYNLSKANSLSVARSTINQIEDIARYANKIDSPTTADVSGNELQLEDSDGHVYEIYIGTYDGKKAVFIDINGVNDKKLASGMVADKGIVFSRDASDNTMILIELTVNDASFGGGPDSSSIITSRIKLMNLSS